MKVQLLYFPGCPNVDRAREVLGRAAATCGISLRIEEIDVTVPETPKPLRAWGSPTILVDGRDVAGERKPTGPSCRLYGGGSSETRGIPPEEVVRAALLQVRAGRMRWLRSLALLPTALLPLLPKAACPLCLAAYGSVLSALGLGFLVNERVLAPLIAVFLALSIGSVAWSSRSHGRPGPLVVTVIGAAAVAAGRLIWTVPAVLYTGVAVLVGASLWNLWLRRPSSARLIQLQPPRGGASA